MSENSVSADWARASAMYADCLSYAITTDDSFRYFIDERSAQELYNQADIFVLGFSALGKSTIAQILAEDYGLHVATLPVIVRENSQTPTAAHARKEMLKAMARDKKRLVVGLDCSSIGQLVNMRKSTRRFQTAEEANKTQRQGTWRIALVEKIREEKAQQKSLYNEIGCFVVDIASHPAHEVAKIIAKKFLKETLAANKVHLSPHTPSLPIVQRLANGLKI